MAAILQTTFSNAFSLDSNLIGIVRKSPVNDNPSLVPMMAWRQTGDKPLSEPMMTWFIDAYLCHMASKS